MTDYTSLSLPEGYDLRAFDILDSTNLECRRLADQGHGEKSLWIVADQQTMGRGRRGREWVSVPGNLFASLLYAIDCDLATASQLSFVAALAVRAAVADILQNNDLVKCKWPNDVLVGGRKISGILLESAGQGGQPPRHVIIGIGINLAHHPEETVFPATDLAAELGRQIATTQVMEQLAQSMAHWLSMWQDQGFGPVRKSWKDNADGLGRDIIVRLPGEELSGRFVDLDETGALILEFAGERRHITAGDVFFA